MLGPAGCRALPALSPILSLSAAPQLNCVPSRSMGRRAPKQGKPPILPPSKKVLYHVVHVPWQKPEHVKELLWRRHAYNNAVVSLREVFRQELTASADAGLGLNAMKEEEAKELDALLEENERRNQQRAAARQQREAVEWKQTQTEILDEIERELKTQREQAEKAGQTVRAAIERSSEFVTKENLEKKIREALENPAVYDFAIDRQGNKIYNPAPVKYQEGTPTRQKSRLYDVTLGVQRTAADPVENEQSAVKQE